MPPRRHEKVSKPMQEVVRCTGASAKKVDPSNIRFPVFRVLPVGSENIRPQSATEPNSATEPKLSLKRKHPQGKADAVDEARVLKATAAAASTCALIDGKLRRIASKGPLQVIQPRAEQISQPGEAEKLALLLAEDDRKLQQKEEELERGEPEPEYDSSVEGDDEIYDEEATEDEDDQPTARKRQKHGKRLHNLHSDKVADKTYNPSNEESAEDGSSGTEEDD